MTEEQWLACTQPMPMLEFLRDSGSRWERKLRLFAAACCRRAWPVLDANGRATVEMSERFADGLASEAEVKAAIDANRGCQDIDARAAVDYAAVGAWRPTVALLGICGHPPGVDSVVLAQEQATRERAQADLLRCVLGPLPFRSPRLDPCWRTPLVRSLARAAYEERVVSDLVRPGWLTLDPARLLVLADALEDAGADEPEILGHLRQPGEHIRSCWCIDLLLARS
jgi:hypothetical protein